uniref:Uncharacterized protein n=1 Tax=Ralstonia solanacearum CFBP2957 TaxID=859656 RepID=D8P5T7_RALSL|nr:protein of unknown function [Ralstonia solanacearum CFBP2957]
MPPPMAPVDAVVDEEEDVSCIAVSLFSTPVIGRVGGNFRVAGKILHAPVLATSYMRMRAHLYGCFGPGACHDRSGDEGRVACPARSAMRLHAQHPQCDR